MGKSKANQENEQEEKKGLQLEPGLVATEVEDDLDCSKVKEDSNLELWLMQIPVDFPLDEKVVWQAVQSGSKRLNAKCQIEDAGYRLVEEQELSAAPVYAIGGNDSEPVKVTRRVSVLRQSEAQEVCFGVEEDLTVEEPVAAPAKAASPPAKTEKAAKEKKDKEKKKKKKSRDDEDEGGDVEAKKKKSKKK